MRLLIIIIISLSVLNFYLFNRKEKVNDKSEVIKQDSCQYLIDSLLGENQELTISKTRYEIILEKIGEVDSSLLEDAVNNVE